jgi:hypothetical protein
MTPRYFLKIAGPPSQCGGCRPPWQHLVAHAGSKQRIRLADITGHHDAREGLTRSPPAN